MINSEKKLKKIIRNILKEGNGDNWIPWNERHENPEWFRGNHLPDPKNTVIKSEYEYLDNPEDNYQKFCLVGPITKRQIVGKDAQDNNIWGFTGNEFEPDEFHYNPRNPKSDPINLRDKSKSYHYQISLGNNKYMLEYQKTGKMYDPNISLLMDKYQASAPPVYTNINAVDVSHITGIKLNVIHKIHQEFLKLSNSPNPEFAKNSLILNLRWYPLSDSIRLLDRVDVNSDVRTNDVLNLKGFELNKGRPTSWGEKSYSYDPYDPN